jgi:hypothetical protein
MNADGNVRGRSIIRCSYSTLWRNAHYLLFGDCDQQQGQEIPSLNAPVVGEEVEDTQNGPTPPRCVFEWNQCLIALVKQTAISSNEISCYLKLPFWCAGSSIRCICYLLVSLLLSLSVQIVPAKTSFTGQFVLCYRMQESYIFPLILFLCEWRAVYESFNFAKETPFSDRFPFLIC